MEEDRIICDELALDLMINMELPRRERKKKAKRRFSRAPRVAAVMSSHSSVETVTSEWPDTIDHFETQKALIRELDRAAMELSEAERKLDVQKPQKVSGFKKFKSGFKKIKSNRAS